MNKTAKRRIATISEELKKVADIYGSITPHNVVEHASNPDNPIHKLFEWDNDKAATNYRLWQARHLISSCVIEVKGREVREFHNLVIESEDEEENATRQYVPFAKIVTDEMLTNQMLENAKSDAKLFSEKYSALKECAKIVNAISESFN